LVLIVRACFTEQLVSPVVTVVVVITHELFVDTSTVSTCELTRGADPAVALVAEVSAVVVLVTNVDSQDALPIGALKLVLCTTAGHLIASVRTVWDAVA
jgi:hypothetical protein